MLKTRQMIDAIESTQRFLGKRDTYLITAHPMLAKEISRSHLRAACKKAGYKVTIKYSQQIGQDKLMIQAVER